MSVDPDTDPPSAAAGPLMTRRTMLKTTAGAAAGATLALGAGPTDPAVDDAEAIAATTVFLGGAVVGAAGYALLTGNNDPDREDVEASTEYQKHVELRKQAARFANVREDNVLSSMENEISNLRAMARENAIFEIFEAAASDVSREEAHDRAQDVVDEMYAEAEKSVINRYNGHVFGLWSDMIDLEDEADVTATLSDDGSSSEIGGGETEPERYDRTLLDGSSQNVPTAGIYSDAYSNINGDPDEDRENWDLAITYPDPDDYGMDRPDDWESGSTLAWVDTTKYIELLDLAEDEHQTVSDELSALVDDHYDAIAAGDVDMSAMLSSRAMVETATDADSVYEASLIFHSMGLPVAQERARIELEIPDESSYSDVGTSDDETTTDDSPDLVAGEGILAWSLAHRSDQQMTVDTEIKPSNYPGQVYFAGRFEREDGSTDIQAVELVAPFTITAYDGEGETVAWETREMASSDVSTDEAIDVFESTRQLEQDARSRTVDSIAGGDGGLGSLPALPDWIPGSGLMQWGVAAGGAIVGVNLVSNLLSN